MPEFPEQTYSIDDELIDIVSTPDTLGGAPRIDGHRIAVYHVLGHFRRGHTPKEIASEEVYPTISEEQVRAALHYSIDYPAEVEASSQPRETPLKLSVSYDSKRGGPRLSIFDLTRDEPGAIATTIIGIEDLPDQYDEVDLHAAWAWMFEQNDRPRSDGSDDL